jgi:MOSC domain-containing protein YiiM
MMRAGRVRHPGGHRRRGSPHPESESMDADRRVISLNLAAPRTLTWRGKEVPTGIFKEPVAERRMARAGGLEEDRIIDRRYHGAPHQALYAYPSEHYAYWADAFPGLVLDWGAFGENLTTQGLAEDTVRIGDRFRIGGAEVEVTQPRWPCFKLGRKLGRPAIVKRLLSSGRTGFYLRVTREGEIGAGDPIERVHRDPAGITVADLLRLSLGGEDGADPALLARTAALEALPEPWRAGLRRRLAQPG